MCIVAHECVCTLTLSECIFSKTQNLCQCIGDNAVLRHIVVQAQGCTAAGEIFRCQIYTAFQCIKLNHVL